MFGVPSSYKIIDKIYKYFIKDKKNNSKYKIVVAPPFTLLQDFSKKEQEWLEMLLKKIATEAIHLASESSEKFISQISLGSKNGNNKDKQTNKTKVATISEKTKVFSDGIEEQKPTLQKLMEKFSRK